MSPRVLASNAVKLALLMPILLGAPQTIKLLCTVGILLSLVVDFMLYRRDKAALDEEDDGRIEPVPLPPAQAARRKR